MSQTRSNSAMLQVGMVATVRNRRGVISRVHPFDGYQGRLHLVDIEYNDGESPPAESLLWECEPVARLLPPTALPDPAADEPMRREDLLALLRACRWSARMPFVDPDGSGPMDKLPISAPFQSAVQTEDFQLMPLLKALRMPRVSLLLADDVGLGKTIEAGLILSELLLRRRVRRVLIMTPASLRVQWRDELWEKFALPFDIVDRASTVRLRRQLGLDANPWRSSNRIIASYHYLKQPDILEQFRAASAGERETAHLPWDLLIVDEAHHLTPAPFGEESDLCKMLRQVAPLFEHRLFLTATPHNGHTRSFTGLLEVLDPVRFSQSDELSDAQRARVPQVVVRRLKREINARSTPKRFCDRLPPESIVLTLPAPEQALSEAFGAFRAKVRSLVGGGSRRQRLAGNFAIEILGKRLLSCPTAFAQSWQRCRMGMQDPENVTDDDVLAAKRSIEDEDVDDREVHSRVQAASTTVGAWLRPMAGALAHEAETLDAAVAGLALDGEAESLHERDPKSDVRYDALSSLVNEHLKTRGAWRDDERLVVFTEYKTTLDYLVRRLRAESDTNERILPLYGGMDDNDREVVKAAFNDPESSVRILVGTDAASEGLNLQETARFLLHFDVPWNPARLEQRNGRLDRHGQPRDVTVWHFVANNDQDLAFLDLVVRKVDTIREDLGATGEVFDELTHRRLIEGEDLHTVQEDLALRVDAARAHADVPCDHQTNTGESDDRPDPAGNLDALAGELDFHADTVRATLDAAMAVGMGGPRITEADAVGRCRLVQPHPAAWDPVIDETLRLPSRGGALGALRALTFNPNTFVMQVGDRPVFRAQRDTALMHLGHPMLQRALTTLGRQRFPGGERMVSRWTATYGEVPDSADALLVLSFEELAVNELRETFHHWVRTTRFPIRSGRLGPLMPHAPARALRIGEPESRTDGLDRARDIWLDVQNEVREYLRDASARLTEQLRGQLERDRDRALEGENERYQSRQGEISALIERSTLSRLERELTKLRTERKQGRLFDQRETLDALEHDIIKREEELERRRRHYTEVRDQLAHERQRIVGELIPRRYALRGEAQIMPVTVEIILPRETR